MSFPVMFTLNERMNTGASFVPTQLTGLKLWLKADAGLTLSTTSYAGTGTVTQVGTAITGVGTAFLSEVVVGDTLTGTLISGTVTVITSNTALTVDASNSGAGAAFTINPTAGVTDRVTTLADQSGNGADVTQATAVLKPTRKLAVANGKPSIRFSGGQRLNNAAFSQAQPFAVFAAVSVSDNNASKNLYAGRTASQTSQMLFSLSEIPRISSGTNLVDDAAVAAVPLVMTTEHNSTTSLIRINGIEAVAGNAGVQGLADINIGANNADGTPYLGDIFQLLIYSPIPSAANRTAIENYLGGWLGISF